MNITFTPQPIPELTIDDDALAGLGFTPGTPFQLTLRPDGLWITPVTDAATWNALCEASQQRQDLGADWVRENGELIIGGDWLTEAGFGTDTPVTIAVERGQLVIRPAE